MSQAQGHPRVVDFDAGRSHYAPAADPASPPHMLLYTAQMELVGGIESHVLEFCERFSREGWRVTLVCSRFVANPNASSRLAAIGVEMVVNDSPYLTRPFAKWLWTLAALCCLANRRFDVVYVNGQGRNPATVHRWFRGRVRTVHHHHTACDEDDLAAWPKSYLAAVHSCETVVVCAD